MPHDMFGDVTSRRSSAGSRRSSVAVVSAVLHAAALVTLVIVPLMATGVLPTPQIPIDYILSRDIIPIALPPAPHPPQPGHTQGTTTPTTAPTPGEAAPVVAPTSIEPEDPSRPGGIGSAVSPEPGAVQGLGSAVIGHVEPPPQPPDTGPIHLHEGIRAPQKLVDVVPVYPSAARDARIEGMVIVEATIDVHGNVEAARILKSVPLLDQAALDAVRHWKYTPTLLNRVPVAIIMTVTVNFRLR